MRVVVKVSRRQFLALGVGTTAAVASAGVIGNIANTTPRDPDGFYEKELAAVFGTVLMATFCHLDGTHESDPCPVDIVSMNSEGAHMRSGLQVKGFQYIERVNVYRGKNLIFWTLVEPLSATTGVYLTVDMILQQT